MDTTQRAASVAQLIEECYPRSARTGRRRKRSDSVGSFFEAGVLIAAGMLRASPRTTSAADFTEVTPWVNDGREVRGLQWSRCLYASETIEVNYFDTTARWEENPREWWDLAHMTLNYQDSDRNEGSDPSPPQRYDAYMSQRWMFALEERGYWEAVGDEYFKDLFGYEYEDKGEPRWSDIQPPNPEAQPVGVDIIYNGILNVFYDFGWGSGLVRLLDAPTSANFLSSLFLNVPPEVQSEARGIGRGSSAETRRKLFSDLFEVFRYDEMPYKSIRGERVRRNILEHRGYDDARSPWYAQGGY